MKVRLYNFYEFFEDGLRLNETIIKTVFVFKNDGSFEMLPTDKIGRKTLCGENEKTEEGIPFEVKLNNGEYIMTVIYTQYYDNIPEEILDDNDNYVVKDNNNIVGYTFNIVIINEDGKIIIPLQGSYYYEIDGLKWDFPIMSFINHLLGTTTTVNNFSNYITRTFHVDKSD